MKRFCIGYGLVALIAMGFVVLCGGCLAVNPGEQVRQGLSQRKLYEWRSDGGFWSEGEGPQEEEFTMAQGNLVLREDENGELVVDPDKSTVEYYLHAKPSADEASSSLGAAFVESTRQNTAWINLLHDAMNRFAGGGNIPPPADEGPSPLEQKLDAILEKLTEPQG